MTRFYVATSASLAYGTAGPLILEKVGNTGMKTILLLLLFGGLTGAAASAHHQATLSPVPTVVQATSIQGTATPIVPILPPSGSSHITKEQALGAARQYWPSEFTGKYPVTAQFGGADLSNLQRRINGQLVPFGMKYVWFVTVTGLDEARPAGSLLRGPRQPGAPPVHTRTFVVDDTNGQVLFSAGM